jgi:glycosyltransferase involved in cell wall biosynthesis
VKKGKILIFLGSLTSGGTERVVVALSTFLAERKNYEVTVVTLDSDERDFYTLSDSVKRIAMDEAGATSGFSKFFKNIQRVFSFRRVVKQEKPDLVLGLITRHAVIAILACFKLPLKVAASERNYPAQRKNHSIWEILRKMCYRFADLHVVQTQKIADWIRGNTNAKNIRVIPNSITWPLPHYEPLLPPKKYLDNDDKLILAAGTFKYQKGFDLLLEAAAKFLSDWPEWKLVILGDEKLETGSAGLRSEFEKVVKKHQLNKQILLPGRAGNVGDWYKRAEIFVLSSRYEGFPNVLLEAMASGCASVSFDCNTGPADLINHMENGMLVSPNDTDGLSDGIEWLMKNPEKRKQIGKSAKKTREIYSEEKILNKWANVIEELLSLNNVQSGTF